MLLWVVSLCGPDCSCGWFLSGPDWGICTKYLSVEAPAAIKEAFKQTTCESQLRLSTERVYRLGFGVGFNIFEV